MEFMEIVEKRRETAIAYWGSCWDVILKLNSINDRHHPFYSL